MKKNSLTYFLMLVVFGMLSSCEKDDLDGPNANTELVIHGLSYQIGSAIMWHADNNLVVNTVDYSYLDTYINSEGEEVTDVISGFASEGSGGQSGNFIVSLYGEGLQHNHDLQKTYGEGAMITIHFASSNTEVLQPGSYTFSSGREDNTFIAYSSSQFNFNETSSLMADVPNTITEGGIRVTNEGNQYEILVDCKTSTGSIVKANFKGEISSVDMRQDNTINYLDNVFLDAAFDTLAYSFKSAWSPFPSMMYSPDTERSMAVFNTSTGSSLGIQIANDLSDVDKKNIDLACRYNKSSNSIMFGSPIKLRSTTWHGMYSYYNSSWQLVPLDVRLPCHTIVTNAPENFTVADFDALQESADFTFEVVDDGAEISVDAVLPKVVLFQTGNGLKGAIKITEITPVGETVEGSFFGTYTYPVNPRVSFEIKTPVSPASIKLK